MAGTAEDPEVGFALFQGDLDAERIAGADKVAVFEGSRAAQDQAGGVRGDRDGKVASGLNHGLEHEYPRQNWETGEVVLEVLLGAGDEFQRDDPPGGGVEFQNLVHEIEAHRRAEYRREGAFGG